MADDTSRDAHGGEQGSEAGPARRPWAVLLVVGALVAALVTAIVLANTGAGDSDDQATPSTITATSTIGGGDTTTTTTGDGTTASAGPAQTGPLQVIGSPLPLKRESNDPAQDPAAGLVAPALVGSDFSGDAVVIDTTDGVAKGIVFLAHWCPHCQAEVPRVQEWLDGDGGVDGVDILSVSTAVRPDRDNYPPSAWLEREGWTSQTMRDGDASDAFIAYGGDSFPYWVFIDDEGRVVRRSSGELEIATLEQYLEEAAAGSSVAPPPVDYEGFRAQETACGAEAPPEIEPLTFDRPGDMGIDAGSTPVATIATSCGDVVIELDPSTAPETVNSFVFLAEAGFFDGTVSHRVLPGFVIQAGDPTATGTGGPGYLLPDEFPPAGNVYAADTVAMANAGPGTTGSQFFIMLADSDFLPPDYTIIGHVVDGAETLAAIAAVPLGVSTQGEQSVPLNTIYLEKVTIER